MSSSQQSSRIRIQSTKSVPLRAHRQKQSQKAPAEGLPQERLNVADHLNERVLQKSSRYPTRKTQKKSRQAQNNLKDNVFLVLSGLMTFLSLGVIGFGVFVYAGVVYALVATIGVACIGVVSWHVRKHVQLLRKIKAERAQFAAHTTGNAVHINKENIKNQGVRAASDAYSGVAQMVQEVAGRQERPPMFARLAEVMQGVGLNDASEQTQASATTTQPFFKSAGYDMAKDTSRVAPVPRYQQVEDFSDWSETQILQCVSRALAEDNVDLFIQPIVNLPQRKRRFYEMYSRIRVRPGVYLPAQKYIHLAKKKNMLADIDNTLLLRGLQLIQTASEGGLNRSFFCNISPYTLNDQKFMADVLAFLTEHRLLAPRLIFEMKQQDIRNLDGTILGLLDGLSRLGCRFAMDGVRDLNFDFNRLNACHIRYVKIGSDIMVQDMLKTSGFSHLRRVKDELEYNGMSLIAEKIETDKDLIELLDVDIDYGQGYLFGELRKWSEGKTA